MRIVGFFRAHSRLTLVAVIALAFGISFPALLHVGNTAEAESSSETAELPLSLTLAPTQPVVDKSAQSLEFTLELANSGDAKTNAALIEFFVSKDRVLTREELTRLLATPTLPEDIGAALKTVKDTSVDADSRRTVNVQLDTAAVQLPAENAAGVYLGFARVTAKDNTVQLVTAPFVWQGTGTTTQTPLHTIVPLVLPASIDGMPTATQLGELTASGGLLFENLAAATAQGSTLAIDPRIIVATRALGDRAPVSATDFLSRLSTVKNQTFALQYADADLSAQAQLGLASSLQPIGFSYLNGSDQAEDYSAFPYTLTNVAWPRQNSVNSPSLTFMQDLGFTTVLLDSANVALPAATSGMIGSTRAVSIDSSLEQATETALTGASSVVRASGSANLVAQLALTNQSAVSGLPLTLGIDRAGAATRQVNNLLSTVAALPWVTATDFSTIAQQQSSASLLDGSLPAERIDALRSALDNEPKIAAYSTVLKNPVYLTELQRMRILEFFATRIGVGSPGYEETTAKYFARDENTLTGVRITTTSTTNLVGASTRIPVKVSNELPFTAKVTAFTAAANSSLMVMESETAVTSIEKRSSVNLTVPVQSRVSAGQSALIVKLFTVEGQQVDEAVLPVNIRSSWEAVALTVLGVLVAAFFGFGIWRSIRAKRQPSFAQESSSSEK